MKISAVIPTYNHRKYVCQAVESALAQTEPLDEIIVVDDGSKDDTREALQAYGERIRYIYQNNAGLSAARNTGIREARSEFIALLDADDWWAPEKNERQKAALARRPEAVLAYTGLLYALEDGSFQPNRITPPEEIWPALRRNNLIAPSAVVARRDLMLEVGGFNEELRACEDWDMWVRLRIRGTFTYAKEPLTIYRVTTSSMSTEAERMIVNTEKILEGTLLAGLSGWEREKWRRQIRSVAYHHASVTYMEKGDGREKEFLWKSLREWPWPWFKPVRYRQALRGLLR